MPPCSSAPVVVLDTNAVLDWLLFRNPAGAALHAAIESGRIRWHASPAMRDELAHLLTRADFGAWNAGAADIWPGWERHCLEVVAVPPAAASRHGLRCTDPDDQKFIDFAVACGALWLVSRDRAVLKLGRRLRGFGVVATTPAAWSIDSTAPRIAHR